MSTIVDLLLAVRKSCYIYYHKDTNQFDYSPISKVEKIDYNAKLPMGGDPDNIRFLTYEEINHKEIMSFYVREFVEDKAHRKQLFDILRRIEYMDLFLDKLRELNLYEDFTDACGDLYRQLFLEWADKNGLQF